MMENKKGISPIIATVLLIVIVIAAVALIIAFLIPFIQDQISGAESCYSARVSIKEAESCYNSTNVKIKVSRGAEEFELSDIIFKFTTEDGATKTVKATELNLDLPENPHEERVYDLTRTELNIDSSLEITSVAVAPIVESGTTTKTCEVTSQVAIVCCPGETCVGGGGSTSTP